LNHKDLQDLQKKTFFEVLGIFAVQLETDNWQLSTIIFGIESDENLRGNLVKPLLE